MEIVYDLFTLFKRKIAKLKNGSTGIELEKFQRPLPEEDVADLSAKLGILR